MATWFSVTTGENWRTWLNGSDCSWNAKMRVRKKYTELRITVEHIILEENLYAVKQNMDFRFLTYVVELKWCVWRFPIIQSWINEWDPAFLDEMWGGMILMYWNKSRCTIQQNYIIFLVIDYRALIIGRIIVKERLFKQQ